MGRALKKASDTVKVLGKGVSKETEKALEKYDHSKRTTESWKRSRLTG